MLRVCLMNEQYIVEDIWRMYNLHLKQTHRFCCSLEEFFPEYLVVEHLMKSRR